MGHLETRDVIFAPGFQTRIPLGVRWIPSLCKLLNKGLSAREGLVHSRRRRASLATTWRHGRFEDHEKTRGVSGSEERPRHGKSFKLSSFFSLLFYYLFIYYYYYFFFYFCLCSLLHFLYRLFKPLLGLRSWWISLTEKWRTRRAGRLLLLRPLTWPRRGLRSWTPSSPRPRGIRKALRQPWKGWRGKPRLSASNSARVRMSLLWPGSK